MIQSTCLKGKRSHSPLYAFYFLLRFLFWLQFLLYLYLSIMFSVYHRRPVMRYLVFPIPKAIPASNFLSAILLYNNLFQKFMQTYIERVQDQALMTPIVETREKVLDSPLKVKISDRYYSISYKECFQFVQQCEDHFAMIKAKNHKHVYFATFFPIKRVFAH